MALLLMSHVFQWQRRVEFCETDAAGIVHFSQLIIYMEQAEHALLRSVGLSVAPHATSKQHTSASATYRWPRVAVNCQFVSPARFEDELSVLVSVSKLGEKSVTYSHRLQLDQQLVAEGSITSVCCLDSANGLRSVTIPEGIRKLLSQYASS